MHTREDDDSSLRSPGLCHRLFRFVVAKLGVLGEKEMNEDKRKRNKLIKKGSRSDDITIHFKQLEDSEDNGRSKNKKNNSSGSPSQESERETMITLANGPKKRLHGKEKKSEPSPKAKQREAVKPPQPHHIHRGLMPLVNDINKKSDAFIETTLAKMRQNL